MGAYNTYSGKDDTYTNDDETHSFRPELLVLYMILALYVFRFPQVESQATCRGGTWRLKSDPKFPSWIGSAATPCRSQIGTGELPIALTL
jgi:hypothetical protein